MGEGTESGAQGHPVPGPPPAVPPGQAAPAQLAQPQQAPGYYFAPQAPGQPAPAQYPPGYPPPGQPAPAQYPPGYPPPGQPMPYQHPPGQPVYMPPPGQPLYGQAPQPMYVQGGQAVYVQGVARPVGYEEGNCMCGGDLGPAHWTIVAWLLCIFFCPFNFCYPCCMPMSRTCKQCGRTYDKPF